MQCTETPFMGRQCELEAGHEGKHMHTIFDYSADAPPERYGKPVGVHHWSDQDTAEQIKRHASRFD